jgi:hypothetical protein
VNTEPVAAMKFPDGTLVITPNALSQLAQEDIMRGIERHRAGDWGDLENHDLWENDLSLANGQRLWSVYYSAIGVKFWIITEADRSVTTVLLPGDY